MSVLTRREFLRSSAASSALLTFGGLAPSSLHAAAAANRSDRILVVVELAGGNDGLNTVIPYGDDVYRKLRPKLAISKTNVLSISEEIGFHPALRGFADLLESRKLSVVQGVGYPDPNRSHFESMDIWHTCQRKEEVRTDGWLGRMIETTDSSGSDPSAMHLGNDKQPLSLMSRTVRVPSIRSLEQFHLKGSESESFRSTVQQLSDSHRDGGDDLLGFVQSSTSSALMASERLVTTGKAYHSTISYPKNGLGEQLQTVAKLIGSGLKTSIYYVQLQGFDTHAQQPDAHQGLLRQLGDSVKAFLDDMDTMQQSDRVVVMAFSEFGRRVAENASQGTDHGTAGPMFIAGSPIKSGIIGKHPSLNHLIDGDLEFHTDFRRVYAAVIEDWFGCDSDAILKGKFDPVELFA